MNMNWTKENGAYFSDDGLFQVWKDGFAGKWHLAKKRIDGKWQAPNMECEICWFPTAKSAKEYAQELVDKEIGAKDISGGAKKTIEPGCTTTKTTNY